MQLPDIANPLIVIVGPTAVGKTGFSIQLAKAINGEIVSADSRYFYRGMDIGTAKPTIAEQEGIPHHLVDVTDPNQSWSLAVFQQAASAAIEGIHKRRKLPILVGGTGQYVRAVIEGWQPPAQQPDEEMRLALEEWAAEISALELHRRLGVIDAPAAAGIDFRNMRRTVRALEVIFLTGRRFSEQRLKGQTPYSLFMIGLRRDRTELYQRIDERIDAMIAAGLLEEMRSLLAKGYAEALAPFSAIGYHEMLAVLKGEMSLDEALILIKRRTRVFVRRQAAWFRESDQKIHWFDASTVTVDQVAGALSDPHAWITPSTIKD